MSSPLSVKRRRLNESTAKLSKPFVSPLRTSKSDSAVKTAERIRPTQDERQEDAYLPSTAAHGTRIRQTTSPALVAPKATTTNNAFAPAKSTPVRKQNAHITTTSKRKDPAEFQAERAITALELQIRTVKNDIDTLNQASRISSSTTDADLEVLIQKWKAASQTAAEELFGTVKERVNRMGGVAAWRESEKRKYERSNGLGEFAEQAGGAEEDDDADCEFDSEGEELPEEEQEWRKAEKRRVKKELMEAADVEEDDAGAPGERGGDKANAVWQEGGGEDDAFTMDMMLRSLNIELQVIGYDKQAQRWIT